MGQKTALEWFFTENTQKPKETAVDTIKRLENEIEYYKSLVIMGFYHDEYPDYTQGYTIHEVLDVMTAKEANNHIKIIKELREDLKTVENKADAWVEFAREMAWSLGLNDEDSKGSISDVRYKESKIRASDLGKQLRVRKSK
jgi:hypothetical protein